MLKHPAAFLVVALAARAAVAQAPITGVIRDSLARRPLAGAIVQLAATARDNPLTRSTTSDSVGRFSFDEVPAGRYMVGFIHPLLDSLGIEPAVREVEVVGHRLVRVDLATPTATRLRGAICAAEAGRDSGAAVIGVIRNAQRETVAGASVTAEWLEVSIGKGAVSRNTGHVSATSLQNGWFSLCGLPSAGTIFVNASSEGSLTDTIPIVLPSDRFLHQDLYLGSEQSTRIHGVVTGPNGSPLSGAQIVRPGGGEARTDERGQWSMEAPSGTRMIEVKAIGYYPRRLPVQAVNDEAPVSISLPTMTAMLDTVRITAMRNELAEHGFEKRKRSTGGYFLTAEDISRHLAFGVSDILRIVPGMAVDRVGLTVNVSMRSMLGPRCMPRVFVDGLYVGGIDGDGLDSFVQPNDIAGIEVYRDGMVPTEFVAGSISFGNDGTLNSSCGAIVIWTASGRRQPLTRARALGALAAVGSGLLLSLFLFHGK